MKALRTISLLYHLGADLDKQTPFQKMVEAYHSGFSTELANEQWKSVQQIWEGKALSGVDGIGFKRIPTKC